METVVLSLTIFANVLGIAGLIYLARRLVLQLRGEREVVRRLAQDPELHAWVAEDADCDREVTDDDLDRMRPIVQQTLRHLRDKERQPVEGALWQPSVRGRYNYLYKLLRASARQLEHRHT